jgi:hypothetical protein
MRRYTIHQRFGGTYLPMINCKDMDTVANKITTDEDGCSFKVFDNIKQNWVDPNRVFLACVFSKNKEGIINEH